LEWSASPPPDNPNSAPRAGDRLNFERKDVWDMRWATDNEELFAMMACGTRRTTHGIP